MAALPVLFLLVSFVLQGPQREFSVSVRSGIIWTAVRAHRAVSEKLKICGFSSHACAARYV